MIRRVLSGGLIFVVLLTAKPRKSKAEDFIASKVLYYLEDKDRIKVFAPSFLLQHEQPDGWLIKVDGIYNSISGATPTGAPSRANVSPVIITRPVYSSPVGSDDDDDDDDEYESEDEERENFSLRQQNARRISRSSPRAPRTLQVNAISGATQPAPPPSSGSSSGSSTSRTTSYSAPQTSTSSGSTSIPMADFSDERTGVNLGVSRKLGRHNPGLQLSYSTETDYTSTGVSLQDVVDFNRKNTSLLVGTAYTHDSLNPVNDTPADTKRTVDLILGLTQVLSPTTLFTVNVAIGQTSGYLADPYKVVELNGQIVPEVRPDSKDKQILFVALNQFFVPLHGALDLSVRHYQDSFGVTAETLTAEWFQKVGQHFIVAPMVRFYEQSEADFYAVRFSGTPGSYSSDYRISSFTAAGYGLKLVWMPTSRLSLDIGAESYEQKGTDSETPKDVYASAILYTAGIKWTL